MTAWQSMFAGGACTVEVINGFGVPWSGLLTFGQSSPQIANGPSGTHYVVSVDADGVVSLSTPDGANADGVQVAVFPQYDTSKVQTQITAITAFGASGNAGSAFDDETGVSTALSFDPVTGAATPSSIVFQPHAPNTPGANVTLLLNPGV